MIEQDALDAGRLMAPAPLLQMKRSLSAHCVRAGYPNISARRKCANRWKSLSRLPVCAAKRLITSYCLARRVCKTTLAHIVAHEMEVNLRQSAGPVLERAGDLAALLTNLE